MKNAIQCILLLGYKLKFYVSLTLCSSQSFLKKKKKQKKEKECFLFGERRNEDKLFGKKILPDF
jgi:hypothetical protein